MMKPGAYVIDAQHATDEISTIVASIKKDVPDAQIYVIGSDEDHPPAKKIRSLEHLTEVIARRSNVHRPVGVVSDGAPVELSRAVDEGIDLGHIYHQTVQNNYRTWASHMIDLLPYVARARSLKNIVAPYIGAPGVIIGPGPSLREVPIHRLRELCEGTVSICTNNAAGYLWDHDIRPMIVLGIDALPEAYKRTELCAADGVVCAFGPHAHPSWPAAAGDNALLFVSQEIWTPATSLCRHLGLPSIDSGGSVSTVAYHMLRRLGCTEIGMIGVDCRLDDDLGYGFDGKNYREPKDPSSVITTQTYTGKLVKTLRILDTYRKYFERCAANSPSIKHTVFSPNQARIAGWEVGEPELRPIISRLSRLIDDEGVEPIGEAQCDLWAEQQIAALSTRAGLLDNVQAGLRTAIDSFATMGSHMRDTGVTMASDAAPLTIAEMNAAEALPAMNVVLAAVEKNIERCREYRRHLERRGNEVRKES